MKGIFFFIIQSDAKMGVRTCNLKKKVSSLFTGSKLFYIVGELCNAVHC